MVDCVLCNILHSYIIFTYLYYQFTNIIFINPGFCSFWCLILALYSPIANCLNIGINRFELHLKSYVFNISSILYENNGHSVHSMF